MKKIYLKPETGLIDITNNIEILAFSNQIDNANKNDDHEGSSISQGGDGEGGDDMGAKGFNPDWDFDPDWNFDE